MRVFVIEGDQFNSACHVPKFFQFMENNHRLVQVARDDDIIVAHITKH
jgi:hypothetical protein